MIVEHVNEYVDIQICPDLFDLKLRSCTICLLYMSDL